jgi:hypothetical protein
MTWGCLSRGFTSRVPEMATLVTAAPFVGGQAELTGRSGLPGAYPNRRNVTWVRFLWSERCWSPRGRAGHARPVPPVTPAPAAPARHPGPAPQQARNRRVVTTRRLYPCQCHIDTVPAAPPPLPARRIQGHQGHPGDPGAPGPGRQPGPARPARPPGSARPPGTSGPPARTAGSPGRTHSKRSIG